MLTKCWSDSTALAHTLPSHKRNALKIASEEADHRRHLMREAITHLLLVLLHIVVQQRDDAVKPRVRLAVPPRLHRSPALRADVLPVVQERGLLNEP